MCPTVIGRIHTRVFALIPGAIFATLISLFTGNADWIVLIGVFLLMGICLDTCIYQWAIRYQPPWMTFVLAVAEYGLLLVLANILQLDLTIWAASVLYWIVWSMAAITKVVVFPVASLTYLESAQEFRRIQWSIPPSQASVPILASAGASGPGPGLFEQAASAGASAISRPIERQPSPSGIHQSPFAAGGGGSGLKLVEVEPEPGRELVVRDELTIGRDGCDVNLADALISRRHAALAISGADLQITDLGSSNGTFVNDQRIGEQRLSAGDEVRIGDTVWKVEGGVVDDVPAGVRGGALTQVRGSIQAPTPPSSEPMPSAIQRFPGFGAGGSAGTPEFPEQASGRRASAARRLEATVVSFGIVAATAVGVIVFLAAR